MKIAQLAPLIESCPPKLYGGTERIVANLCDGLVKLGHDVTLFASGDSDTLATLCPVVPCGLRLSDPPITNALPYIIKQLGMVLDQASDFDIIHGPFDFQHFPVIESSPCPWVTTIHGRLDSPDIQPVFNHYIDAALVSISLAQRRPLPYNNWVGNVYHGIDISSFRPTFSSGQYLAFLGRICPEKSVDKGIAVAKESGIPLKIAAKIDPVDKEYYEAVIKPMIDGKHIEYVGEINEHEKSDFLGNALALLFAIDWPEPFGLAIIESYACGTPVVTRPCGSMPEIVFEGKTGYIRSEISELVEVVKKVDQLDRRYIRSFAEEHFSIERMCKDYLKIYQTMIEKRTPLSFFQKEIQEQPVFIKNA